MRLDRLVTLGLANPLGQVFGRLPAFDATPAEARALPVLMYHSISDDPEPEFSPYYKVCTSPARFAEQMRWLADAGWQGVTLTNGLAWLKEEQVKNRKRAADPQSSGYNNAAITAYSRRKLVAITFDDGFRDFHTKAAPILRQYGYASTMYLPTAFIGDKRKSFKSRECLTWEEVRELLGEGMEFGSHTVNHPKLVDLNWPQIEFELNESKTTIEDQLGQTVHTFAYPYAFPQADCLFATRFEQTLQKAGYRSSATTEIGMMLPGDNMLRTKRYPANSCDDHRLLGAKLSGAYDWMSGAQRLVKWAKGFRARTARPTADQPLR